ncbi:MAG: hypothetical protein FK730_07040 [Asgard group archaeon]|nr:hypothetical protein [Asgard group archaeon]
MVNINKTLSITIGGMVLTLLGGAFVFIYFRSMTDASIWLIIAIIGILFLVGVFAILFIKKRRSEESQTIHASSQSDFAIYSESKHQTCYWCGYPLDKHGEYCPDCGKEVFRCTVCKLPISFGDEIGKCRLCESKGHFTHLFEWVKTKGSCPHCLQNISTDAIITVSKMK